MQLRMGKSRLYSVGWPARDRTDNSQLWKPCGGRRGLIRQNFSSTRIVSEDGSLMEVNGGRDVRMHGEAAPRSSTAHDASTTMRSTSSYDAVVPPSPYARAALYGDS